MSRRGPSGHGRAPGGLWVTAVAAVLVGLNVPAGAAPIAIQVQISRHTLRQGEAAAVTVQSSAPVDRVTLRFAGRSWPLYPVGERTWRTYLGTDPSTAPRQHAVVVEATLADLDRVVVRRPLHVVRVAFPRRYLAFDPDRLALLTPEKIAEERRRVAAALRVLHSRPLWSGAMTVPVAGPVSSPYGVVNIYQGTRRGFHGGVDIAATEGTPVYAAATGIVRLAEALPLSGNAVLLDHGLGVVTSYLHLSSIVVGAGQRVARGQLLGHVGSTGLATGSHLHWGLRVNGVRVDPMLWTPR